MALAFTLFAGAAVLWLALLGLGIYAVRVQPGERHVKLATGIIIGGGVVLPVVVLGVLLAFGLNMMPRLAATDADLSIDVTGEQWWWRVTYRNRGGSPVASANEIRLPVDTRVRFDVRSADVIHSFWIPALGGKIDMIPGRTNSLTVQPTRTGRFRGACAEYCGLSHAFMAFDVIVMERDAFFAWLDQQAASAEPPATEAAERGYMQFLRNGCGACHRIAGTPANGTVGPDLTHFGGRSSIGAGMMPAGADNLSLWLARAQALKPGVEMPSYHMLDEAALDGITTYLEALE